MNQQEHLLTGIRVLDFTRALAGPTCTRMFAEMGAEVIKVESAPDGEMTRRLTKMRADRSFYFIQQNLNKKSFCVDLNQEKALELIKEIVPYCDVVVENFRPGVMDAIGFGFETLKELKEDIILCSISALGQKGPLSKKPGYDYIAQAYSGVTSMIGEKDAAPYIPLVGLGDISTGVHGAFGIAAALLHRARTGKGQHLDIALLDCYYHYHELNVFQYSGSNGEIKPTRGGRHVTYVCPAGVFEGTGGYIVLMGFLHHWEDLCTAMDRKDLIDKEGWSTDPDRLNRQDEVVGLIEGWLQTFGDIDSAIAVLEKFDVPCAPVLSVEETVNHPHHVERGTVRTINDPLAGSFKIPGHPIKTSDYPSEGTYSAPILGQHNSDILKNILGKSEEEIEQLGKEGITCEGDT